MALLIRFWVLLVCAHSVSCDPLSLNLVSRTDGGSDTNTSVDDDAGETDTETIPTDDETGVCGDGVVNWSAPTEGFESGDIDHLPWETGADLEGWRVIASPDVQGAYRLHSNNVGLGDTVAWIEVTLETKPGNICFYYRGDSETDRDLFRFYVDGTSELERSGSDNTPAQSFCLDVQAGVHTYRWDYSKDSSGNSDIDRWTIDQVGFPPAREECDPPTPGVCSTFCYKMPAE